MNTPQTPQEISETLTQLLKKNLPDFFIIVKPTKSYFGDEWIKIVIAASNHEINNVPGQYVQDVSLCLDVKKMALWVQIFGGNGGQNIYLIPDKENPKEKYLAMASVKIPFRKPKNDIYSVINAVDNFSKRYKDALIQNLDRLMYQNIVNYRNLLKLDN